MHKGNEKTRESEGSFTVGSLQWAVLSGQSAMGSPQWAVFSGQSSVGRLQSGTFSGQFIVGSPQFVSNSRNDDLSRLTSKFRIGNRKSSIPLLPLLIIIVI